MVVDTLNQSYYASSISLHDTNWLNLSVLPDSAFVFRNIQAKVSSHANRQCK